MTQPATAQQPTPKLSLADYFRTWTQPADPVRIVGPIHFIGTRGLGVYLITTPAGHIMLDGGMPTTPEFFANSIRKLGFKPEDIKLLLITHAHIDHAGTVAYFKRLTGATLAVMDREVDLLKSGGATDFQYAKQKKMHFQGVAADRVLKDGETVSLGNVTMTARLTAGHTRGATTWTTTVEDNGRTYSVVFPASTSVNPGYRLGSANPSYPGIADDYRNSLSVLESLKPDIFLAAHTEFFAFHQKSKRAATEGVAAWVDPEGYRAKVARDRANFESIVARTGSAPR